MYIFFFWPFRVIGFILTLYALAAIAEKFFPNLILGEAGAIIAMFGVILSLLFWINFVDLYFKLMDPDVPKKTRGRNVKVKGYKKAIITLKKGQSIDLTTGI